ncbi:hypothetical protein [Fibrella aquatilis]|uniref:Uncharacterized protein n=1 Tax=Fibrella aquatilis TaxID=2817059 RepID=A0A939G5D7_9BACT|nr:hypothetical protein [Fibrella aquatilis]MBO0930944.1 hypothetical protein [Fibrella aquatilis]
MMRYLLTAITSFSVLVGFLGIHVSVSNVRVTRFAYQKNSPARVLNNSNWVATDALGRSLPNQSETGLSRANKYVGLFYFLWHGEYNQKLYDITKILKQNPTKPTYGPIGAFHWWGEPEAGYYRADDPWLIRRNLSMLTNAGVDVLFMDVTNRDTYLNTLKKLCAISNEMRKQGQPTPYICFVTNYKTKETVSDLYFNFYADKQYSDLWFRWEGKPLILGKQQEIDDLAQRGFFTWRYSWQFTDAKSQPSHWQWLDNTPQNFGWIKNPSVPEEIPVAVASHPVFGVGKSNANSREGKLNQYATSLVTSEGRHFAEQWKRALTIDPAIVFVTGWNEWIAQRYVADTNDKNQVFKSFIDHKLRHGETFFQDLYNEEFNRDIEPMRGGYTDNYYYQLVANIRRFKGMTIPITATPAVTIVIDGKFDEWQGVKPVFTDPQGDTYHRNWLRFDNKSRLINRTGRNDIVESRITYDKEFVYVFAKTVKPISTPTDKNWMLLFIDVDRSKKTGWEGYDLVINRLISKNNKTSVHRWLKGKWQSVSVATYRVAGNRLELSIPSHIVGLRLAPSFDFHWADNVQKWNAVTEFFLNGDSAPDRRFNYRFSAK